MKQWRLSMCMAACVSLIGPAVQAEDPRFDELEVETSRPVRLVSEPRQLSRFPTSFSVTQMSVEKQLRTVDIDGRVWQWEADASQPNLVLQIEGDPACAVLSDDGRQLAYADPTGEVTVIDLSLRQPVFRDTSLSGRTGSDRTVTLCYSPKGDLLAGISVSGEVRIWDVRAGQLLSRVSAMPSPVQTVAFSSDGSQLAIASYTRDVKVFRIDSHGLSATSAARTISIDSSRVTAIGFSQQDSHLVIAAADGTVGAYDLNQDVEPISLGTHTFAVWSIAFEPGGRRMAMGSWDGTIKIWETESWQQLQAIKGHQESVATILFDDRQGLISAGLDGRLLYWESDVPSIAASGIISGRDDQVWVSLFSPDGRKLFIGGQTNRFELWDVEQKSLLVTRDGHPTTRCAAFSPDGLILATGGDDGLVFLSDPDRGTTTTTLRRHAGAVSAVIFTHDGSQLISACDAGIVKMWDVRTGQETASWHEHKQQIYCASLSPDGRWLITGGGNWTTGDPGELFVWDLAAGRVHAKLAGHTLAVWTIVMMDDGQRFASSDSSGAVKMWSLKTFAEERTLQHTMWIRSLALSPDEQTLAVGRGDGSIRLWDTTTWRQRGACDGHNGFTFFVDYDPTGQTLATSGSDGTVRFYPVGQPDPSRMNRR